MDAQLGPEVEVFANALDDCLAPHGTVEDKRARVMELVGTYYDYASERLAHLRGQARQGSIGDTEMDLDEDEEADPATSAEDVRAWEQEKQTWDLIRRLIPLRYPLQNSVNQRNTNLPKSGQPQSDDLWSAFLASNPLVIERKMVLEWLQQSARAGPEIDDLVRELQQNADRGDIIAHGWIHTRSAIKLQKSVVGSARPLDIHFPEVSRSLVNSDNAPLVAELDPDSVTRQDRKLEPQDEYFERAIWVGCFHLLRRGMSLDAMRDWCFERTEVWRAVSMSALPLAAEHGEASLVKDPSALALWRRMCFALARRGGSDDIERAVYGVLSGDMVSVQKVCKTWDDVMFMNYNALVRSQFDAFVLDQCPSEVSASLRSTFASFDAVQYHGDPATLEHRLIKSLEIGSETHKEAFEPVKVLQAAIISKDLERHFYEQGLAIGLDANSSKDPSALMPDFGYRNVSVEKEKYADMRHPDLLRLAVHALIIFATLDRLGASPSSPATISNDSIRQSLQDNTITLYISLLRLGGFEELIPLYCSRLVGPRALQVLSINLLPITDNEARLVQLSLIRKAGLDVLNFVKFQPQFLFKGLESKPVEGYPASGQFQIVEVGTASVKYGRFIKSDFFGEDPESIDPLDERLIRSVEWMLLVDEAWSDVFAVGVAVYKYFLKHMRLNAARSFASRVSFSDIIRLRNYTPDSVNFETSLFEDMEFWARQIEPADTTRLSPGQVASDAQTLRELECLVKALDAMETIASLAQLSREDPTTTSKREFWTKVGNEVKATKDHVRPLLKEWLLSQDDSELNVLRDTYLPETLLAYVSTLHFAGTTLTRDNFLECMELAATIAEKNSDIAACFKKAGRIKELVEAFAAISKALAITSGEKKAVGSSSKKLREMGWSRDLWSVKK
ncbi:Nucleoporin NUP84 [Colletotrichum chlorophyti]|uniref:Nuclear pore complex protein n=1 Tax=Colletotrichum chlorophyti TaxID=708187 RepID=A0A1Q8S0V9_9PEZI|nr:Nucleoporin NUP84 [Colletotrichum chlorophyti]